MATIQQRLNVLESAVKKEFKISLPPIMIFINEAITTKQQSQVNEAESAGRDVLIIAPFGEK